VTVWAHVDTRKQVGDENHLKPFASSDAQACLAENDPEGVALEYPVGV
jgi:hypothetical protein